MGRITNTARCAAFTAAALLMACNAERGGSGTTNMMPKQFAIDVDPPGAVRGARYRGVAFHRDDPDAPIFARPVLVSALPFNPQAISRIEVKRASDSRLHVEFDVAEGANSTELLEVHLKRPDGTSSAELYIRTVDPSWDVSWRPTAVAPPDTSVPGPDAQVILDASHSLHPAGRDALRFTWILDGSTLLKGEDVTSTTLPTGEHTIVLEAEDRFGYVSRDTMRVHVGP